MTGRYHERVTSTPMLHAPDIDVAGALDVEHQMGITRERPETQTGQIQLNSRMYSLLVP